MWLAANYYKIEQVVVQYHYSCTLRVLKWSMNNIKIDMKLCHNYTINYWHFVVKAMALMQSYNTVLLHLTSMIVLQ